MCLGGAQIEGGGHAWVGDKLVRRWLNTAVSVGISVGQTVTREVVDSLAGSWNASLLYRRPMLSLLDHVYRGVRNWDTGKAYPVPWQLREELVLIAGLAPFMRTNIRAQIPPFLYHTDASLVAGLITRAIIPEHIGRHLHFWGDMKGARTWLAPNNIAVRNKRGEQKIVALDPIESAFLGLSQALKHDDVLTYRFAKRHHINILDNVVYSTVVKHVAHDPSQWCMRGCVGVDSKVTPGARNRTIFFLSSQRFTEAVSPLYAWG